MRPDEHKRKKNADYKKKHGIPLNKDTKNNDDKHGKATNTQNKQSSADTANFAASETTLPQQDSLEQETKTFSRRKVTSNWERYEDFESSESISGDGMSIVQRRGADFAELLEGAGNSHSQFRFQDEKEWEDDSINSQQATQSVLEVNFQELSESLKILPLFQRLNLDIKDINTDLKDKLDHSIQDTATINTKKPCKDTSPNVSPSPNMQAVKPSSKIDFSLPGSNNEVTITAAAKSSTDTVSNKSILENNDNELEFLLSLDNTASKYHPNKELKNHNKQGSLTENINSPPSAPVPKQEEDLEDWLDSVLG